NSQILSAEDFDLLLDWLDKVRIGVWLAFLYLDQMVDEVQPVFRIFTRVGLYDRAVAIFKVVGGRKQLRLIGPEFPCFQYGPTTIALFINNYCLVSFSAYDLCSQRLGFPFPSRAIHHNHFRGEIYLSPGTEKLRAPVISSIA